MLKESEENKFSYAIKPVPNQFCLPRRQSDPPRQAQRAISILLLALTFATHLTVGKQAKRMPDTTVETTGDGGVLGPQLDLNSCSWLSTFIAHLSGLITLSQGRFLHTKMGERITYIGFICFQKMK